MEIVPVMDLRGKRAVHARGGDRAHYPRVHGVLGSGDDPLTLAAEFRDGLGCRSLYLADLDAIVHAADPAPPVRSFAALGLRLLVDAGTRTPEHAEALLAAGAARVVVGLETLRTLDELAGVVQAVGAERVVFGLDLRAGHPLACSPALAAMDPLRIVAESVERGVEQVLCLDLARVGAASGPARAVLAAVRERFPRVRILAGGGVRNVQDLVALAGLGCSAALVATALHSGAITRADLDRLRAGPAPGASAR